MLELLRDIGRAGPQNVDERAFLHELLLVIGEGRNVVKALRLDPHKAGHKEASPINAEIVREVDELIAAGVEPEAALKLVAKYARSRRPSKDNVVASDVEAIRRTYKRRKLPANAEIVRKIDQLIAANVEPEEALEVVAKIVNRDVRARRQIYSRRKDKS